MDFWFVEAYSKTGVRIQISDLYHSKEQAEKVAMAYQETYDADVKITWIWWGGKP